VYDPTKHGGRDFKNRNISPVYFSERKYFKSIFIEEPESELFELLKKEEFNKKLIPNFSVSMVVSQHNEIDKFKPILEDSAKKIGLILSKKKHNNLKNR